MTSSGKQLRLTHDPLAELMQHYAGATAAKKETSVRSGPVEERLKQRIIDGDKAGLQADLDEALHGHDALAIINTILLDGMKTVGDLFGSGQMQLPFVLQSAEVMKAAVAYLEQFMDKEDTTAKGTLVIATVKGDVHDIGKNLVDIILTNNGYRVVNLGIKCPVETMIHAAREHNANAIGMSGLLVKSTLIMKENLEVMNEQDITIPVVLGGAALTRRYVEQDLRAVYGGKVFYANDAFDGLSGPRWWRRCARRERPGLPPGGRRRQRPPRSAASRPAGERPYPPARRQAASRAAPRGARAMRHRRPPPRGDGPCWCRGRWRPAASRRGGLDGGTQPQGVAEHG